MHDLDAIKNAMPIIRAWNLLGLPGEPRIGLNKTNPFRDERTGSFSIYDGGRKWKDFGNGDGSDIIDFWERATGKPRKECIEELAKLCGVEKEAHSILPYRKAESVIPNSIPADAKEFEPEIDKDDAKERLYIALGENVELIQWLASKQIKTSVVKALIEEGSIGMTPKKQLCFFFERGVKIRGELSNSHSSFWEKGSSGSAPWRFPRLHGRSIQNIFICEGESDLMRICSLDLKTLGSFEGRSAVLSMPSASWRPDAIAAYVLGAFRKVIILADGDKAGDECADRLGKIFKEHADKCEVYRPRFPDGMDCCKLSEGDLYYLIDNAPRI